MYVFASFVAFNVFAVLNVMTGDTSAETGSPRRTSDVCDVEIHRHMLQEPSQGLVFGSKVIPITEGLLRCCRSVCVCAQIDVWNSTFLCDHMESLQISLATVKALFWVPYRAQAAFQQRAEDMSIYIYHHPKLSHSRFFSLDPAHSFCLHACFGSLAENHPCPMQACNDIKFL